MFRNNHEKVTQIIHDNEAYNADYDNPCDDADYHYNADYDDVRDNAFNDADYDQMAFITMMMKTIMIMVMSMMMLKMMIKMLQLMMRVSRNMRNVQDD